MGCDMLGVRDVCVSDHVLSRVCLFKACCVFDSNVARPNVPDEGNATGGPWGLCCGSRTTGLRV